MALVAAAGNAATTASHFEQALRRFYQLPVSAAPVLAALEHRPPIAAFLSSSFFNPSTSSSSCSSSSSSSRCKCKSSAGGGGAAAGRDLYQPFRRPPVVPPAHGLSMEEQLEILRERRGQWHEHGKVIPNLMRAGYTPSMLDEATGLTGVEQNQIVVASQVRDTLASGGMDKESLAFFDAGGSAVLYELRILSAQQRKSTAEFVIERKMDAKGARDLARAVKDFDRRKRELGWDLFSSAPGDCLAFWWYRQSKEFKDEAEQEALLRKGLEYATTENARSMLKRALGKPAEEPGKAKNEQRRVDLCVVRLELGETAGMVMLPVADSNWQSIKEAPSGGAQGEGGFRIHRSHSAWKSWVPLPGWQPILEAVSPITVLFPDTKIISSQEEKAKEEEMLLVADKGKLGEIKPSSMYLVDSAEGLRLQPGAEVSGDEALAEVLIALSPPRPLKEAEDEVDWD